MLKIKFDSSFKQYDIDVAINTFYEQLFFYELHFFKNKLARTEPTNFLQMSLETANRINY